jgi:hypothetical protein
VNWLTGIIKASLKRLMVDPEFTPILNAILPKPEGVTAASVANGVRHSPEILRTEPRKDRTKVLVCGILPNQQSQFSQTFPDLHLKFWFSDRAGQGLDTLKAKAKWADKIFHKMDQSSHSVSQTVKAVGKSSTPVNGSVSAMMNVLAEVK